MATLQLLHAARRHNEIVDSKQRPAYWLVCLDTNEVSGTLTGGNLVTVPKAEMRLLVAAAEHDKKQLSPRNSCWCGADVVQCIEAENQMIV